ncbi:MAG: hypothetical protein ABFC77_08985 [Thermoguttaceae bacterium]
MANQYGPWATLIDAGGNPQLSSFWRRRLTMLVPTSRTSPVLSRRNLLWLGTAGALASLTPTLRLASAMADDDKVVKQGDKSVAGRIFLHANLKTKSNPANRKEDALGDVRGIIAVDPDTGRWEEVCPGDAVRVAHNGKSLAFTRFRPSKSHAAEFTEIETYDLTTHRTSPIGAKGDFFFWSPDDRQIVTVTGHFTEDSRSENTTWLVQADGSARKKLPVPETDLVWDWSADGKWFVAVTNRKPPFGRGYQLYRMRPDGSEELLLTKDGLNCYPRFSPDSQKIVYLHQTAKDGNSLHVMDVDGSNDREILREEGLESVEAGCFSPDGRHLVVLLFDWHLNEKGKKVGGSNENRRLAIMDADGTNRRPLPLKDAKILWLGHPDW